MRNEARVKANSSVVCRLAATGLLLLLPLGCRIPEGTTPVDHAKLPDELGFRNATHVARGRCSKERVHRNRQAMIPLTNRARKRIARSARKLKASHAATQDHLGMGPQICYRYFKDGKPNGPWLCVLREHCGVNVNITQFRAFRKTKDGKFAFRYFYPKNVRFHFGWQEK